MGQPSGANPLEPIRWGQSDGANPMGVGADSIGELLLPSWEKLADRIGSHRMPGCHRMPGFQRMPGSHRLPRFFTGGSGSRLLFQAAGSVSRLQRGCTWIVAS